MKKLKNTSKSARFPSAKEYSPTGEYFNIDKEAYCLAIKEWIIAKR